MAQFRFLVSWRRRDQMSEIAYGTCRIFLRPALIIVGIAFLVPIILSHLRGNFIPIIVGEILAGIIVGKSGLNLVDENIVLEILSTLGFIFLMFLSGLEINISVLLRPAPIPTPHPGAVSWAVTCFSRRPRSFRPCCCPCWSRFSLRGSDS